VALDARKLFDGGIGTYIRGLLGALASAYPRDEWTALVDPADAGRVRWPGPVREHAVRAGKYGLAEHVAVPAGARRAHADLLHAPHYTLPLAWRGPCVVTIHDLIHIRFARFHAGRGPTRGSWLGLAPGARPWSSPTPSRRGATIELLGAPEGHVRVVPLGVRAGSAAWTRAP
jgi:hypothetical protein